MILSEPQFIAPPVAEGPAAPGPSVADEEFPDPEALEIYLRSSDEDLYEIFTAELEACLLPDPYLPPFTPRITPDQLWRALLHQACGDLQLLGEWLEWVWPDYQAGDWDPRRRFDDEPEDEWAGVPLITQRQKEKLAYTGAAFRIQGVRKWMVWSVRDRKKVRVPAWQLKIDGPSTGRAILQLPTGSATRDRQMEWLLAQDEWPLPQPLRLKWTEFRNGGRRLDLERGELDLRLGG
jgi:hypothetical protein